jgi:DUF971 family protein
MKAMIEGTIVTEKTVFGSRDVKVLTVNRAMNYAVIQFRDLKQTPSEQNTYSVTLDKLQAK